MDAVVFSSFIPNEQAMAVGKEFIEVIGRRFSECDIYVGINYGSIAAWQEYLESQTHLSIIFGWVDEARHVDSDASGFQRALELVKDSGKEYNLIWFGHTKGATSGQPELRHEFIESFFERREHITHYFDDPKVGSHGLYLSVPPVYGAVDPILDKVYTFPYRAIDLFYLYTFYVIRGSIVHRFIHGCSLDFFSKNLVSELGYDRYFSERDFSSIADRMGYYPSYQKLFSHLSTVPVTEEYVREAIRVWEQQLPLAG